MNAGTPPAPGASQLTIETYRVRADGERVDRTPQLVYRPGQPPLGIGTLRWPPCRCPRCRAGDGPRGGW
ncbi:hypothetical protein AB0D49_37345 [Streptomyces sp. NPDC048290]|uniref:hypothetical protein n=1 Tax=Streptomyces sp. NPDC048290 TaxID=3155811 RepID=UPI003445B442